MCVNHSKNINQIYSSFQERICSSSYKKLNLQDNYETIKNKFDKLSKIKTEFELINKYHDNIKLEIVELLLEIYTGIFAISYNGVLGWDLYEKGGIDSDRLYDFLEKHITTKYKNKLIILDNASSHRNAKIKELVNKHNTLLYSVPYQHFTNSIENYFSMMKSRLYKLDGLTHKELKTNIDKVIKDIPKDKYENIIKGTYNRTEKYHKKPSNRRKTLKNYK